MVRNRIKSVLLAATALAVMAPAAFAADSTQVTVTGGTLSITNPLAADFANTALNGTAQTKTASLSASTVSDGRGSGAGWHTTAQATRFSEYDATLNAGAGGYVAGGKQLPASSLTMSQPTVSSPNTTSPDPTIGAGPYTLDGGSAATVASAAADAGMGDYDFGATTLSLAIPADAYAKTYRSDVTISAVTGP